MSLITVDNRPINPLILLVDNVAWSVVAGISKDGSGVGSVYVNPAITYDQFLTALSMFASQTLVQPVVLTDTTVLTVAPLIAQLYQNSAVPTNMHFTLKAGVQGFNGNNRVNSVTLTDSMLETFSLSFLKSATSLALTITST